MTVHPIRLFLTDDAVRRTGQGMLDKTLPKDEWTHEAHLATCLWLLLERQDVMPERDLPGLISDYNIAVGGENTDSAGYHETLTQLYVKGVRAFAATLRKDMPLIEAVNALLASEIAARDWPLCFYSRDRLFSVEARRGWIEPDLASAQ
jgi:hypothetical protein